MALVVIVVRDTDDGKVDVSCQAEPGFPGPSSGDEPTPAHSVGIGMLNSLSED